MIDQNSVSAAEVFAAAIKTLAVARSSAVRPQVVCCSPTHTVVAGVRAARAPLHYHTVNGARIEGSGVTPDVQVTLTLQDYLANRDPDLDRVRELLSRTHAPAP